MSFTACVDGTANVRLRVPAGQPPAQSSNGSNGDGRNGLSRSATSAPYSSPRITVRNPITPTGSPGGWQPSRLPAGSRDTTQDTVVLASGARSNDPVTTGADLSSAASYAPAVSVGAMSNEYT